MIILDIIVGGEYNGCTCHCGHPPCSYCVDTFECEKCGERCNAEDQAADYDEGLICLDCKDMKELEEGLKAYNANSVVFFAGETYVSIPGEAVILVKESDRITLVKSIIKWLKRFLFSIAMAIFVLGLISACLWHYSNGSGQMAVVAITIGSLALFGAYIAWRIQSILDQA